MHLRAIGRFLEHMPTVLRDFWLGLTTTFRDYPIRLPFTILGFILMLYTGTLFVLTPIVVPILSLRAWWRALFDAGFEQPQGPFETDAGWQTVDNQQSEHDQRT